MATLNVTTEEQKRSNANDLLAGFIGGGDQYRYILGTRLTEGAKAAADQFQCFWFLDVIASYQGSRKLAGEEFQVWKLKRTEGDKFIVTCDDGNENIIASQNIPFSDFPHDDLTIWLVHGVMMLPSEY